MQVIQLGSHLRHRCHAELLKYPPLLPNRRARQRVDLNLTTGNIVGAPVVAVYVRSNLA